MDTFDIYFRGETLPEADPAGVRKGVARLFRIDETAVDRLFSGTPVRVKRDVDADTASRYRAAFRDAGALIQVVPAGAAPPDTVAAATGVSAPADAGVAAGGTPLLAEPGAIIDLTPPPPPAEIDTSRLEALPPNSGTLEDCRVEKTPQPIPDTSHLRLIED